MTQFLTQHGGTALIVLIIVAVLVLIIRGMYRDKKAGKRACGSCGGGCASCGGICDACNETEGGDAK